MPARVQAGRQYYPQPSARAEWARRVSESIQAAYVAKQVTRPQVWLHTVAGVAGGRVAANRSSFVMLPCSAWNATQ